jgi:hypothetical protein
VSGGLIAEGPRNIILTVDHTSSIVYKEKASPSSASMHKEATKLKKASASVDRLVSWNEGQRKLRLRSINTRNRRRREDSIRLVGARGKEKLIVTLQDL